MEIWSAWLQGRNNAPEQVKKIFSLWEELNPEHNLNVIEHKEAEAIIEKLGIRQKIMTPQVKTNFVRTYLLSEYGGVWVDSTLLPTMALKHWLSSELVEQGFFAFRSSGAPELVLQNWFLFSEKKNPIISSWLEYYCEYFNKPRYYPTWKRAIYHLKILDYLKYKKAVKERDFTYFVDPERGRDCSIYPYAVHNYNFRYLIDTDNDISYKWSKVPKLYNTLPTMLGHWANDSETPEKAFIELALEALPMSPVHKLNHRDPRFSKVIDLGIELGYIR